MKVIKIFIFFILIFSFGLSQIKAKELNENNKGISISPAELNIYHGISKYELVIKNNYSFDEKFDLKTDILDNIDLTLAKKQSIAPFVYFNENSFKLKPNEQKIITIYLNNDIDKIQTSLYGKILIITQNSEKQTTINHGFGIPIIRNIGNILGKSTEDLEIKNINFEKKFFTLSNEAKINFDIYNKGETGEKIYGEYQVTNENNEVIFHKIISDLNYKLNPSQTQNIQDLIKLEELKGKYKLEIMLSDGNGNIVAKGNFEILAFNTSMMAEILGIIVLFIVIILNFKRGIRFVFKRKALKLNSIIILFITLSSIILPINAQVLKSNSYQIPESDFTSGNESTSTTYRVRGEQGNVLGETSSSTSYGLTNGTVPLFFNYVPPAPTVSNNSGTYYDRLNIIINTGTNPTDSDYAIFVTSTAFAGVRYVQSDNTLGASLDNITGWRKYNSGSPSWGGGTGFNLTGLNFDTPYTFYIKSRQRYNTTCALVTCNLPASESPIVLLPSSEATPNTTVSTALPTLSFQIIGNSIGGINDTASTSSAVDFGILSPSVSKTASNTLRVTTNAQNGYEVNMSTNQKLQSGTSYIDWFTGGSATYASPQSWSSPTASYPNAGWIGYDAQDSDLTQFSGAKYAPFPVTPTNDIVTTSSTQNASAQDNDVTYKIEVNPAQPAGNYTGMTITYILTGNF